MDESVPEQRIVEAAGVLPSYGGITGWAALRWLGGIWFEGTDRSGGLLPIDIAVPSSRIRSQPGIHVCTEGLAPPDVTVADGLAVTTAVRSVCFAMRYARTLVDAVVVLDMAAYSDLVSIAELRDYALAHPAWTGIPQCRDAIRYADENAWSPQEVRLAMICAMSRLPRLACNAPVFDLSGHHIGTPDLFEPRSGLAVEYDGRLHLEGTRRASDLDRDAHFRAHGIEPVTIVSAHMREPYTILSRLSEAYLRALRRPRGDHRWTLEQPDWWVPTATVEQRRALTPEQRARWLKYRLGAA